MYMRNIALAIAMFIGLSNPAFASFTGPYSLSNADLRFGLGDGYVVQNSPDSVTLAGNNKPGVDPLGTVMAFYFDAPVLVSFDWTYSAENSSSNAFFFTPNHLTYLTSFDGQSGSVSQVGQKDGANNEFGWNISSFGNGTGRGYLTIFNFSVSPIPVSPVPEPNSVVLLCLGLMAIFFARRRNMFRRS